MAGKASNDMIRPVILAGGAGSRLWPVSRAGMPKPLQSIAGAESMLEATLARVAGEPFLPPIIVADERHEELLRDRLDRSGLVPEAVLLEPVARNTAAAIALAAQFAASSGAELLLVLPSDHLIQDVAAFREAVAKAVPAARRGKLITFGIVPDRPHGGYGYIQLGEVEDDIHAVARFVEKPEAEVAAHYLREGGYLWNSGIFLFRAAAVLEELERFQPAVIAHVGTAFRAGSTEGGLFRPDRTSFVEAPAVSFDRAVMERTDKAAVVPVDMGWSDIGSWAALWEQSEKDEDGNVLVGNVAAVDCRNSLIRSDDASRLAVIGVDRLAVVATDGRVLVANLDRAEEVGKMVDALGLEPRTR